MSLLRFVIDDDIHVKDTALKLDRLLRDLQELREYMSKEFDDFKAAEAEQKAQNLQLLDLMKTAVTTLNSLVNKITDPEALKAMEADTRAQIASLKAGMLELASTIEADTLPPTP